MLLASHYNKVLTTISIRLLLLSAGIHPNPGMSTQRANSITSRVSCATCGMRHRADDMCREEDDVFKCKGCIAAEQGEEEEEQEEKEIKSETEGKVATSRSKRARAGVSTGRSTTVPPSAARSPLGNKKKQGNLDPDVQKEPDQGEDFFPHDLDPETERQRVAELREVVTCSQTALTKSQGEAGTSLLGKLLSFLSCNKKPIRTSFLDHDRHLLLGIVDSLVRTIHSTVDPTQQELLLGVFAAFPAIYCSKLRGGPEDRRRYTTFLRKRRENPNFTQHVLYLVKPKEEDDDFEEKPQPDARSPKERIESLARRGKSRQALNALERSKALAPTDEVKKLLQQLHPAPAEDYDDIFPPESEGGRGFFTRNTLLPGEALERADLHLALRGLKYKAAPSASGWTKEHVMMMMGDGSSTVADFLPEFFNKYLNLKLPKMILSFSANSSMFGLMKSEDPLAVRPVAVPCFLNKLAWKLAMSRINKSKLEGTVQMGLNTRAGCQAALYTLQTAIKAGKIVLKVDSTNAFNTVMRARFLKILYGDVRYKPLWPLLHINYQEVCFLFLPNGDVIFSREGTRQGGVEGSFIFSVALQSINNLSEGKDGVHYVQIIDDIFIILERTEEHIRKIPEYYEELRLHLEDLGLKLRPDKTKILCQPSAWDLIPPKFVEHRPVKKDDEGVEQPADTYFCMGGFLLLNFDGDVQATLSKAIKEVIWGENLDPYAQFQLHDVDLQLQHYIFQTSTIPSVEYLLGASWEHHDDKLFYEIREWYINHFMPLGDKNDARLATTSGPLTKALLHLPICAGGGLGIPSPEKIHYHRQDLDGPIHCHSDKYPWLHTNGEFAKEFRKYRLPYTPKPMKDRPTRPYSVNERLVHHFTQQVAAQYYNWEHHERWLRAIKFRDTRVYRIPPEAKRHKIQNTTFRYGLAAVVMFVPGLTISPKCTNNSKPSREEATSQADVFDHVMHCAGCAASAITRKHNAINYAVRRVCRHYGIDYTMEPRGLPMPKSQKDLDKEKKKLEQRKLLDEEQKKKFKKQDGPDGLLNTHAGLTALEIHCPHQRLYTTDSDATNSAFDSVAKATSDKKEKYKTFNNTYGGIAVEIFTVSTGCVIVPHTLEKVKENWLPVADQNGRGLLRMLQVEVAFDVTRAVGTLLQLAKTLKMV
ncbi:MAG: hypothetical protein COB65_01350 [Thalassobium sp.]|nr:MAG: hypothetical protein COB65_01350 [Thalassobium sp.]